MKTVAREMVKLQETIVNLRLLHQFLKFVGDEMQMEGSRAVTNSGGEMHCNLVGKESPAFADLSGIQTLNHRQVEVEWETIDAFAMILEGQLET